MKDYVGQHYFYLLSVRIIIYTKNAFEGASRTASCLDVVCVNYHFSNEWLWQIINSSEKSFETSSWSALFMFVVYVNNFTAKNEFEWASCMDVVCVNYHSSNKRLWEIINSSKKSIEISSLSTLFLFVVFVNNYYTKKRIWESI